MDTNDSGTRTPPPPPSASGTPGGVLVYPTQPPKDPIVILLLNLVACGGVGYLMIGQKTKGIVAIVAWAAGLLTCGIGSGIVAVFAAIDGYMQALELQAGHPVGEWTWFKDHR